MLTADNITVCGGEVDSLIEANPDVQLVSNKLYVSHFLRIVYMVVT